MIDFNRLQLSPEAIRLIGQSAAVIGEVGCVKLLAQSLLEEVGYDCGQAYDLVQDFGLPIIEGSEFSERFSAFIGRYSDHVPLFPPGAMTMEVYRVMYSICGGLISDFYCDTEKFLYYAIDNIFLPDEHLLALLRRPEFYEAPEVTVEDEKHLRQLRQMVITNPADLDDALAAVGLPYPVEEGFDEDQLPFLRDYIAKAAQVLSYPQLPAREQLEFIQAITERVGVEFHDCWDDFVALYWSISNDVLKLDGMALLLRVAGTEATWVDKVIDIAAQDNPEAMREWITELTSVVNQTQWNKIVDLLVTDEAIHMAEIAREKLADKLAVNNVIAWLPNDNPPQH